VGKRLRKLRTDLEIALRVPARNWQKMKIFFSQIYIEAGISFPFSFVFQRHLSDEVSALIVPSPMFLEKYGSDWNLAFRINAKSAIQETEVRGPTVFRKDKNVEYSIFLPFSVIRQKPDVSKAAIQILFDGFLSVLTSLGFSTEKLETQRLELIERICSDPAMFNGK
jgi:hypothetical protein